jgi:hypothetical protein
MSKLVLKRFRCITESNEIGDDSPHFLIFHGKRGQGGAATTSNVELVRRSAWDNTVSSGDPTINADFTVPNAFGSDLVLVAMMEEDWDPDFTGLTLLRLRGWICPFFNSLASSVAFIDGNIANIVLDEYKRGINALRSNDEVLGVKRLSMTATNGLLPLLKFTGDGSNYDVRFTIE